MTRAAEGSTVAVVEGDVLGQSEAAVAPGREMAAPIAARSEGVAGPNTGLPIWVPLVVFPLAAIVAWVAWKRGVLRAEARDLGEAQEIKSAKLPALAWFMAAFGMLFFASAAAALAQQMFGGVRGGSSGPESSSGASAASLPLPEATLAEIAPVMVTQYVLSCGLCLVVLFALRLLMRRGGGRPPVRIELATGSWLRDVYAGLAWMALAAPAVLAAAMLAAFGHQLLTGLPPDRIAHGTLRMLLDDRGSPWAWGVMASVVIGAPLLEECLYRGMVQTGLRAAGLSGWPAIVFASTIFASVHVSAVPLHALVPLCVLGLALGLAYERSQRLLVPMTMHAAFNAGNILIALATN